MSIRDKIFNYLTNFGLSLNLAKIITAQAAHETAGFTSINYLINNNCFGMKYAGQPAAIGDNLGYAQYADIGQSCSDLVRWLNLTDAFNNNLDSIYNYVSFIKSKGYFEAPQNDYLDGMINWYNKLFMS